jgi:uncharacterized membrane protein
MHMSLYLLIVFVHVAAAVALLSGSVIASPAVRAAVRRADTAQELRAFLTIGRPLSVLNPVSALLVLGSGIYLASMAHFWSLGWVQVAVVFWLVNSVTAGAFVKPAIMRVAAEAATASEGPVGERLDRLRWSPRWSFGGDLLLANDVAMLFLMTMKPKLAESLLAVVLANVVVLTLRLASHRSRSAAGPATRSAVAVFGQQQLAASPPAPNSLAPVRRGGAEFTPETSVRGSLIP